MTQFTVPVQRGNIVETHYKITGLEYDAEYEMKLFAVNKQGDSEPDVRTFKTKSGMYCTSTLSRVVANEINKYSWVLYPLRSNTAFRKTKN